MKKAGVLFCKKGGPIKWAAFFYEGKTKTPMHRTRFGIELLLVSYQSLHP